MYAVRQLLHLIVWVCLLVVFGRLILDWIRVFARDWRQGRDAGGRRDRLHLTDPPLRALRRWCRPCGSGVALDLAFLLLVVVLYVLLAIL